MYHVTYNKSVNERGGHITLTSGKEIAFLNNFTKAYELKNNELESLIKIFSHFQILRNPLVTNKPVEVLPKENYLIY